MESFWRSAAITLGKRWSVVAVVLVAITILLGVGATRVEFATGQDSYLNADSQIAIDNREFQGKFGGETVILLFSATDESADITQLFEGENLRTLGEITNGLGEIAGVESVVTPLVSITFSDALVGGVDGDEDGTGPGGDALLRAPARDEAGADARSDDITVSLARRDAIDEGDRVLGNTAWNELLIFANDGYQPVEGDVIPPADADRTIRKSLASTFPNQQTAVGGVILKGNATLDEQSLATADVLELLDGTTFDGFELTVTGSPVYLKEVNDYLQGGMVRLGLIAIIVMAVILWFIFKVRWRLLPLLSVLIGVIWSFSFLGWIGIDLSLVTIAGLPILIGLGIDFAIQVHNRIEEEVIKDHAAHPIGETLANLAPPLIAATFTGVAAFVALRISKVPMIRDFGVLLGVGIVMLVIVGIVLPASFLGIREWVTPTKGDPADTWIEHFIVKLGSIPVTVAPILAVIGVGMFVGGILVEGQTRIESDPIRWVDQGSQVVTDIERLEDETGFSSTLGVLVESNNVFDQQVIDLVHDFTLEAEAREEVVSSSSLVNTLSKILAVTGATEVAPTEQDVYAAAEAMPDDIRRALVSYEDVPNTPNDPSDDIPAAMQLNLRLAPASLEERAVLVDELRTDLQARIAALDIPETSILLTDLPDGQPAVRAVPAGLATVGIGLLENLEANRAALTYLALGLAGLYLVLRTRSLGRAVLALVPVFLAIGAGALIVWALDITLSPLTTVSGPLVVASVAEFSVLIMGRHIEERQGGLDPHTAVNRAARRTGRAFFTSALTIIGGFAVLITSSLPLLRDFGLIVTLNVAIALLSALVLMPPLLVWADERGFLHLKDQEHTGTALRLAASMPGPAAPYAALGVLAFGGGAVASYLAADTSDGETIEVAYAATGTTTTTTTSTTTTSTTTTTLAPGVTAAPTTEASGPRVDPSQFPDEVPPGGVSPVLYGLLTDQGVAGNVAHCAVVTAYDLAGGEQALLDLGLVAGSPEALAIVRQATADCGIPEEQSEAAIAVQFPNA
jgi:uncharacterized protein